MLTFSVHLPLLNCRSRQDAKILNSTFATRRHFLRTREFNLIPSPLTERSVLNEGRVLVLNQSIVNDVTYVKLARSTSPAALISFLFLQEAFSVMKPNDVRSYSKSHQRRIAVGKRDFSGALSQKLWADWLACFAYCIFLYLTGSDKLSYFS